VVSVGVRRLCKNMRPSATQQYRITCLSTACYTISCRSVQSPAIWVKSSLKSADQKWLWGFKSPSRYHKSFNIKQIQRPPKRPFLYRLIHFCSGGCFGGCFDLRCCCQAFHRAVKGVGREVAVTGRHRDCLVASQDLDGLQANACCDQSRTERVPVAMPNVICEAYSGG